MAGASTLMKVFVYGTLKKGEPNHGWLTKTENGSAQWVGTGRTAVKYPLVIASRYNIPFLLDVPGTGHNVEGEVYQIDTQMLASLDILEGYPEFYSRREEQILLTDSDQQPQQCWVYLLKHSKPHLLQLPLLTSYSSTGPHGLVYCERYLRDPNYDVKTELVDKPAK